MKAFMTLALVGSALLIAGILLPIAGYAVPSPLTLTLTADYSSGPYGSTLTISSGSYPWNSQYHMYTEIVAGRLFAYLDPMWVVGMFVTDSKGQTLDI